MFSVRRSGVRDSAAPPRAPVLRNMESFESFQAYRMRAVPKPPRRLIRQYEVEVRRGMEEGTQRPARKMPFVKRKKRKPNALLNYCVGEDR